MPCVYVSVFVGTRWGLSSQLTALSLQGVDNVERCDSLAFGVFGVGDCVTDDTFKEGLEDTAGFFVDHC